MKYKKIKNSGLGVCHVLKESEAGYLIYSERNIQHFIVCKEIIDDYFSLTEYFSSLDSALEYFNKLEKEYKDTTLKVTVHTFYRV